MTTIPQCEIYALTCTIHPEDGVRYIGQTREGSDTRLKGHLSVLRYNVSHGIALFHSQRWIQKHSPTNISVQVLETLDSPEQLNEAEARWIAHYRAEGADLTNIGDGGDSVWRSQKRPAQSARMTGSANPSFGQDRSAILAHARSFQGPVSDFTRARLSAAAMGQGHSAETRAKMSASKKAWATSARGLAVLAARRAGVKFSNSTLTPAMVLEIRANHLLEDKGFTRIAKEYGVSANSIQNVLSRKTWVNVI